MPGISLAEGVQKDNRAVVTMDEVVVTATKTEEKRKDISNSVIIIDEMEISESPSGSLGELLANELGIDWRTRGNYGGAAEEIRLRGMSGNATQVLINGMSINSPSMGNAEIGRFPLNNIERIEIVKGAGSLLYGSGAMGGTVNIITKRPKKGETDLKATMGYGSNDTYRLAAEQGMFAYDDLGYYLTANRRETNGFRDNGGLAHNDVSLKLVLDKGDKLDISLYGDYIDRKYGIPGPKPPEGTGDFSLGGTKFYNKESASLVNRGANKDGHLVFQIKGKPTKKLDLNFKQSYLDTESYNFYRNASAIFPKLAGEGEKTWVINEVAGTEFYANIKAFENVDLLAGAEYKGFAYERKAVDLDTEGDEKVGTGSSESHHVFSKGAYTEAQYRPSKFFKALAGIRYEKHSRFGHEILPRYGLVINPFDKTTLKLNHGRHFKAPTMNDLYWPDTDGWTRGEPDLKAEKGWHSDATLEQSLFNDKIFFSLSYFHWDVKDKIAWAENSKYPAAIPGFFKWTPSNVDTNKGDGWEMGTRIGPIRNTLLSLSYTCMDPREQKKGGPIRQALYSPKRHFKGDFAYWFDFNLTVTATARYVSDRPGSYANDLAAAPQNTLDSYWTTDLKLEQNIGNDWLLSLQANNLFNKEYYTFMEPFTDSTGTTTREKDPGAGRSVFFSVTYEY